MSRAVLRAAGPHREEVNVLSQELCLCPAAEGSTLTSLMEGKRKRGSALKISILLTGVLSVLES